MRKTLSVAICVIVSLVLLAILTRYLRPHWILATLHSLQFHAAAACVAGMALALLIHRNLASYALLLVALLLTAHPLWMAREIAAEVTPADQSAPTFRLMSFNILSENYENAEGITRAILSSGADVVNIMEGESLYEHLTQIATVYPYRVGCGVLMEECDQMMFSKTPIENASVRSLSNIFDNRFIMGEVTVSGRKVHVVGIHTTKPYFDNFHTMELMNAALAITATDGPLVLSGDFNASSLPPNMRMFLNSTGLKTAAFEPPTWPVRARMLGLAIDHVYVRAPLKMKSLTRMPNTYGSNHAGLIADIAITGP